MFPTTAQPSATIQTGRHTGLTCLSDETDEVEDALVENSHDVVLYKVERGRVLVEVDDGLDREVGPEVGDGAEDQCVDGCSRSRRVAGLRVGVHARRDG
jgi:hypothetical protein